MIQLPMSVTTEKEGLVQEPCATPTLLDVRAVAALLSCSSRHVYRMAESGRMPPPIHLGSLVRWSKPEIDGWIANSCQPLAKAIGKVR